MKILEYAHAVSANDEVCSWLKTVGSAALKKEQVTNDELEHVVDYLVSPAAPTRLRKLSITDAKKKTTAWTKSNQKKGSNLIDSADDIETVHQFSDGSAVVRLKTKQAFQREGFLMSHCVGGYSPEKADCEIYSYRDSKNQPHATFELRRQAGEILQIKGKGNGSIHPKYIEPILTFLKTVGMEVRTSEMRNLGYYLLDPVHLEFVKGFGVNLVPLYGSYYVVDRGA